MDLEKEINEKITMELFDRVNIDELDEIDIEWLSPKSNSTDFEFDPNSYLRDNAELESMNFLPIGINETRILNKREALDDPVLTPLKAISEVKPQQNESKRKRTVSSQRVPSSTNSEDDDDALSSPGIMPKTNTLTRRNGSKRKPAVLSKRVSSSNNSEDEDEAYFCQPNMSKNAIAARENRLKKKRYVEELEKSVNTLKSKNSQFESKMNHLEEENHRLRDEIEYLRNVLANSDDIAVLIDSINTVNKAKNQTLNNSSLKQHDYSKSPIDVTKVTTRSSNKRKMGETSGNQENHCKKLKTSGNRPELGGVCLHVNNGRLALECCVRCSASAYNKGLK